ncbi:minichromosome maintenance domain-containing protein 2 [Lepisosteus oculatus]|uniref:minichromosome maintenance domain-containing protein 2 n=1 Tax=Lepisosteus oculatus TaxID=7918 RepID=UPI00372120D0
MEAQETLELKEAALSYMDRTGGLQRLIEDCRQYTDSQQSESVYRFCVRVNPTDVTEIDARLGNCILHDPLKAAGLFQSVCFISIKTLSLIEKIYSENQVSVVLKLTHVPPFPDYLLDLSHVPRGDSPMRPLMLEGLAMAMTLVTKYTQGARFLCTEDSCPNSQGFQKIRVHVPGATEWATVRNDFTCSLCGSPLKEDVKSRVLGDKQLVEVIHAKALRVLSAHTLSSSRHQSLTVFLRDELCNSIKIGRLYRIIGIPAHVHQWPNVTFSVEANSVQPWVPECPSFISDNFQALLSATACSPWRFPAIVANAFGSQIVPPGLYNTLKLCLLLSLVQTAGEDRETLSYLDVLALTTDTLVIDRLMTYSLALASRGVRHRTSGELFPSVSRDEHGTGAASIHAGAALLATGGICFIGDLASCRKDKAELLQSALETRAVTVFIPGKKYGEDADQQLSLPLQCNIWALADTGASTKKFLKYENAALGSMDTGFLPSQMSDAFGLVIHCRELPIERPALPLAVHILRQAVKPEEPLYPASEQFTTDDYKGLIAAARGVQAELSPEAERLIHGYFLASRRVRTGTAQGPKVPVASVKLLFSFAEAHAKLSLRSRVLEEDAVIAVLLCENSITLKHGASALVLPPEAVFPCGLHDQASLERRDLALRQLHQQILQFVLTYAPGASSYISEE